MTRVSRTKGYRRFYADAGKGFLIVSDGEKDISIPIGTDGTLLKADSSTPSGLAWTDLAPEFMEYIGNWDASNNIPSLQDGSSNPDSAIGNVYRVNVAGTQDLGSGSLTFEIGDFAILNNDKVWERAPGAGAKVTSVNSQIGDVVLDTDDIAEGSNKYFSDTLAKDAVVVNSLAGSETDQSPSVAAVNSALGSILIPQEIIEADDLASFPVSGEAEKVYIAKDTNLIYRWDGAAYQELSPGGAGGLVEFDQEVYVAKNGNDGTADGSLSSPFLTVKAAMASITDASPTKRYMIKVQAGRYNETGDFDLKANVFVAGTDHYTATVISATSFRLDPDFSGNADHRSGFANCTLIGVSDYNWTTVTSSAGKLYFNTVAFNSAMSLTGFDNGIAQTQMVSTIHFGNFTVSGINMLTVSNRFYNPCFMNQHPTLPTIWDSNGGSCGGLTMTTTVNNFNRRCSMFAKNFFVDNPLLVDGPVSYFDYTAGSLPNTNSAVNGGQLIQLNPTGANAALSNLIFPTAVNQPIMPANTNATNFGDWGKQWFWNFSFVHASTGTDCFLISYPSAFGADAGPNGKSIGIYADGAGLQSNVNGGNIVLQTAAVSGTGVRGRVRVVARELNVNNSKITEVAAGNDPADAVNVSQLNAKQDSIGTGTTSEFLRGDLTWQEISAGSTDVIFEDNFVSLPAVGDEAVLYGTKDENLLWRWGTVGQPLVADWIVGPTGDFASLADALASVSVVNGDVIEVQAGTYTIASTLVINKEVAIFGAGIGQTILQTDATSGDPVSMISVTANNVFLSAMTIKHRKTSNTSVEVAVNVSAGSFPTFSYVSGFIMDSCRIEFCEFGVVIRGNGFKISNNQLAYATGTVANSNRGIGVYGSQGNCFIAGNVFDNSVLNGTGYRAIYSTQTNNTSNELCSGKLIVAGNSQLGTNIQQFYLQDNVRGTAGDYDLFFLDNTINETSLFAGIFLTTQNQGDLFGQVVLEGNSCSNQHSGGGKGLFAIDGAGTGLSYRAANLPVHSSGNTLGQLTFRADFAEAINSTGAIVGYKPAVFNAVAVDFDSIIPATPAEPSTPGESVPGYVEMSPANNYRSGEIALVNGQDNISVVFSSNLGTNDYSLTYSVINTVDVNPIFLTQIITSKSSTGFSVKFHQNPDSNNYVLQYHAVVFK